MDQRAIVARPHASYGLGIGSSLHSHYQPQQSQPQPQQVQQLQQQQQQAQVHQGQQPPSIPQQRPPPPINVQSPTRPFYPQSQDAPDVLEESLKRTVKIVYWYKAGHEPVRIHQEVSSYPYVRLAMFSHLVSDLGLTQNSLVDAYDADYQTWGQQHITTVQTVKAVPCLLYRARKSLLEGLADHECPGLEHELRLQHQRHGQASPTMPSPGGVRPQKRPAPDGAADSASKHFRTASQGYVAQHTPGGGGGHNTPTFAAGMAAQAGTSNAAAPLAGGHLRPSPASPILHSPFMPRDNALHPPPDGDVTGGVSAAAPSAGGGSSSSPHPPLKRWPNDYAVCQIAEGFRKMDTLIRDMPSMTQRCAFEQIFGCRYVKSTVCRHRGVWKRADGALKDAFERLGPVEGALWGEFVKKTDFRREGPRAVKTQQEADDEAHAASMRVRLEYTMDGLAMGMLTGDEPPPPPMASLVPPSA